MIKAVLFDLDGTLLDTAPDLVATLNYLRAGLGLVAMSVEDLRHFVSRGAAGLINAGMPPCDENTLEQWRGSFLSHYQDNSFINSRPFDGVELLLTELRHRNIPWGIVTNKLEYLCVPILQKTGWLSSAAAIIYGDTLKLRKPHPEPVLSACGIIGIQPASVLMVGDDQRDVEAGQRAGSQTALALYGYAANDCSAEVTASTALVNSPPEVLDLLDTLQQ